MPKQIKFPCNDEDFMLNFKTDNVLMFALSSIFVFVVLSVIKTSTLPDYTVCNRTLS